MHPSLPPSPALDLLLGSPPYWRDPAIAAAQSWVWAQLAGQWSAPTVAPAPDASPQPGNIRRQVMRGGAGAGVGLGLLAAAGAAALPVLAAGAAAYGYRWYRRRQQPATDETATGGSRIELRRLRHCQRWVRDPEIHVLPPGASYQYARTTTVGLSRSIADELGAKIGLERGLGIATLNAELSRTVSHSLSVTNQQEETFTVSIENDQADVDRHYAMWRVEHRVTVDELVRTGEAVHWQPQVTATFHRTPMIRYTMTETRRRPR
jgi:hypothetical protein